MSISLPKQSCAGFRGGRIVRAILVRLGGGCLRWAGKTGGGLVVGERCAEWKGGTGEVGYSWVSVAEVELAVGV